MISILGFFTLGRHMLHRSLAFLLVALCPGRPVARRFAALALGAFLAVAAPVRSVRAQEAEFDCRGTVDGKDLVAQVERQYEHISDLAANFRQSSYFLGTDEHKQSQGKVYFLRPGKMDWVYSAPDEQRFVSDGKIVWWYQPSLEQVNIRTLNQSFVSDVPVSFLLGVGKLHEEFKLESACSSSAGTVLSLQPNHPSASLDRFLLLVDSSTRSPRGARILDVGGNETTIVFEDVVLNHGVDAGRFHFDVPRGTYPVDERSETAGRSRKPGAKGSGGES